MKKLYISDLHFFHSNVIKFDNRPYSTVEEMTECIIENWNSAVRNDDHVYVLGDMFWRNSHEATKVLDRLNGNIHLITGNHDRIRSSEFKKRFVEITDYKKMTDTICGKVRSVILSHYYMPFYDTHYYEGILLHGHSHMTKESEYERYISQMLYDKGFPIEVYNVGCMYPYINYTPKTLEQIVNGFKKWVDDNG